jgi:UDP-glucose 4-epimerase
LPQKPAEREGGLSRVLVTGAGGYLGGRLVRSLMAAGLDVQALVRERVPWVEANQTVGDLAEMAIEELHALCEGADAIVHLAGENEVVARQRPAAALADTVVATEKLVEGASGAGVGRLIYLSTVHVYGERIREGAFLTEDLRPEPRALYAISRLACEHLAAMLRAEGTDLVVFRLTNSVGAPAHPAVDRWTLVTNDLCRQGALTGELQLTSSGVQWRDFIAVEDVCAIILEATRGGTQRLPAGTYNLGSGRPSTVRDLARLVQDAFERMTGERPPLHALEPEATRPKPYRVSVERLQSHGLRASTPLAVAIDETVQFCLKNQEELR